MFSDTGRFDPEKLDVPRGSFVELGIFRQRQQALH
jgi:hypothetical protein